MADQSRMDVGFQGGQVLAVRALSSEYDAAGEGPGRRQGRSLAQLTTDDSEILIDLSQVVYVRRESGDQKVGF